MYIEESYRWIPLDEVTIRNRRLRIPLLRRRRRNRRRRRLPPLRGSICGRFYSLSLLPHQPLVRPLIGEFFLSHSLFNFLNFFSYSELRFLLLFVFISCQISTSAHPQCWCQCPLRLISLCVLRFCFGSLCSAAFRSDWLNRWFVGNCNVFQN